LIRKTFLTDLHKTKDCICPLLPQCLKQLRRWILPIPLRIILNPLPQIRTCLLHRKLGLPAQDLIRELGIGRQVEDVALSPLDDFVGQVATDDGAEGFDDFEDGASAT